jgi:myo-inositol-hexaphosphate 3-phosphohydrolase
MKSLIAIVFTCLWATTAYPADIVQHTTATVETAPVSHTGDAADDPAFWVHPTDTSKSMLIGSDKDGGIVTYALNGALIKYYPVGLINNVDLRYNFKLAGVSKTVVAGTNRSNNSILFMTIDPSTRELTTAGSVSPGSISAAGEMYGFCMYHSPVSNKHYAISTHKNGVVYQYELIDNAGKITGSLVRKFDVGGVVEGCTADDELAQLYVGEEAVALWKYGAEPNSGSTRTMVDKQGGHLMEGIAGQGDIEGVSIYYAANGKGYLLVSSQGNNRYVVYDRAGANTYIGTFDIVNGAIDGTTDTDGIDVISFPMGAQFPKGAFIAQDFANYDGTVKKNQNFKVVPWEQIAGKLGLMIDISQDPRKIGEGGTSTETLPTAPSNLQASALSSSQIKLSFTDNSNNESAFVVERSRDNNSYSQIATLSAGVTSFTDAGLSAATPYYFRVKAINSAGSSGESNMATATTLNGTTPTPTPSPTSSLSFNPVADARVTSQYANQNFGSDLNLTANNGSLYIDQSFLKFTVSGIAGRTVVSAKLRLYTVNGSIDGAKIVQSSTSWLENTITYATRPSVSSVVLDDKGSVAAGVWIEYNLSTVVKADGTYSFALIGTSNDKMGVKSRETIYKPQLVLSFN